MKRLTPAVRAALLAIGILSSIGQHATAKQVHPADTSRGAREEAIRAIPFQHLSPRERTAVQQVLQGTTLYRRLPTKVIDCDPHMYLYLLRHPEVVTNIWQVLGIGEVSLQRIGEKTFRTADGEGTKCDAQVIHDRFDTQLIYCRGSYNGTVFSSPIQSNCVLLLRTAYQREPSGRYHLTCRMDVFLEVENGGAALLVKTLQTWIGRVADYNFTETMQFVANLSRAAETRPDGAERLAQRMVRVPAETRQSFINMAHQTAARAEQNSKLQRTGHIEQTTSRK